MNQKTEKKYVGIDNDINGGMTDTGKIIRDAWVFGIIPESQTCAGWNAQGIEDLWAKVNKEWEKYGFQVNNLPPDTLAAFIRIHDAAIARAKQSGWNPDAEIANEDK